MRIKGEYYCSCESIAKRSRGNTFVELPWKIHKTEVDSDGICTKCGYYGIFLTGEEYEKTHKTIKGRLKNAKYEGSNRQESSNIDAIEG